MRKYIIGLILIFIISYVYALEMNRTKGIATYIVFPLVDSTGTYCNGVIADSEKSTWGDNGIPSGFTDCANEATQIGTTGIYYLSLTAAEMTTDYMLIQIKSTDTLTQSILVNTKPITKIDTLVTGVTVYQNLDKIGYLSNLSENVTAYTLINNQDKSNYKATLTENVTSYQVIQGVTVSTNLDKDGYTSTLTEKVTCYSNLDKSGYTGTLMENVTAYQVIQPVKATLVENVTSYTLINNQDKTGYKSTLIENVTAFTLITNQDKTSYQLASNQEVKTTSITFQVADTIWQKNIDGSPSNTAGFYVIKGTSTGESSSGDWTAAEKANIKSALTIEGSTPTWRLDMIDRDIRIFR
jgi:hypothetical protein